LANADRGIHSELSRSVDSVRQFSRIKSFHWLKSNESKRFTSLIRFLLHSANLNLIKRFTSTCYRKNSSLLSPSVAHIFHSRLKTHRPTCIHICWFPNYILRK